ncbi:hypothetical protein [Weissella cibaria]|uniref:hypothetical protein n=1 Tax=Weissella cibaria TaxID=137591 RepID=UPI00189AF0BD|nr:hypothetical protein [Weissella cibaria]
MNKTFKFGVLLTSTIIIGSSTVPAVFASSNAFVTTSTSNGSLSDMVRDITGNTHLAENDNTPLTKADREKVAEFVNAIRGEKSNFSDATFAQQFDTNTEKRGKATIAAKLAAKSMKAALRRIGPKAWKNAIDKMGMGSMAWANWTGINDILDLVVNSGDTIENAMVNAGMPRWAARAIIFFLL